MIQPSLGRVVWFTPYESDTMARDNSGRCAALVTYVHSDRMVNLAVFDGNGNHHPKTSVKLLQEEDERPTSGFCEWMPFQLGQAQRTQAVERQLFEGQPK